MKIACTCEGCGAAFEAEPDGGHRLLCGDATSSAMVEAVMDGERAAVCLTDPPYGLGDTVTAKNRYDLYDDSQSNLIHLIAAFMPLAQGVADRVVLTPGNSKQRLYPAPTWEMAWFVPAGTGMGPWGFCCWQPILCYGKDPKLAKGKGSYPDAIVHTESAERNGHPCPKPIKFWSWLVERTSEPGDLLFDPFSGSGTTIMAGHATGRVVRALEISPSYCDIAVRRWEAYTGQTAVRIAS